MRLPKEIIYEIYSFMGNTDKRRLRQTSTLYHMKFKEKEILEELIEDGYDIPPKAKYYRYVDLVVRYGRLDLIKTMEIRNICYLAAKYGQLNILR